MKHRLKTALKIFLVVLGVIAFVALLTFSKANLQSYQAVRAAGPVAPALTRDGVSFRDLNKNGKLDVYEDKRRHINDRVEDLLQQMSLEEKAGLMFYPFIFMNNDGTLVDYHPVMRYPTAVLVLREHISHFSVPELANAKETAIWHNTIQRLAERTRLGIPITIGTEFSCTYQLIPSWRLRAGYTYLAKDLFVKPGRTDRNNATAESNDPRHQALVQSMIDIGSRAEFGLLIRYVDKLPSPEVDRYVGMDMRLSYRPISTLHILQRSVLWLRQIVYIVLITNIVTPLT